KRKLQMLVSQVDPTQKLDPEMEEVLLTVADQFIERVAFRACKAAKHRDGSRLEVKDVQLELERHWNLRIPGYATEQ
ncbi:transcription initiation factor, partial [Entophlyctis helioformis]